jgi:hypothetical protein
MLNPRTHRKILKKGNPGRARITSFAMPSRGASYQNIPMTLEVHVEGLPPYEVEDQWIVSSKETLGFGLELPVRVDADKPERVAIDWKAARAEREAEKQARQAALASQPPVGDAGGVGGIGTGIPSPQAIDARHDPELRAKLERVLGRPLKPGSQDHIDTSNDPALAARIMQVVQQHRIEKQQGSGAGFVPAPASGEDSIGKLERLAKLRDSGVLTDAEFEQEKGRILGGG